MARSRFFILFIFVAFISLTCSKKSSNNSNPPPADSPSVFQIDFPHTGVTYTNGFNLVVSGTITDNNIVATAKVEIKNKTTGAILYQQTTSAGNVFLYRFSWNWIVTGITGPTPATVKITSTDFYNYQASGEIDITLDN
ncbi:MAG TPA: hypothetical protein VIV35_04920 [Chitinophagaceae bacterium]